MENKTYFIPTYNRVITVFEIKEDCYIASEMSPYVNDCISTWTRQSIPKNIFDNLEKIVIDIENQKQYEFFTDCCFGWYAYRTHKDNENAKSCFDWYEDKSIIEGATQLPRIINTSNVDMFGMKS